MSLSSAVKRSCIAGACLILLVALYWSGFHGSFFFDDGPTILVPEDVRLETLSLDSVRRALISGSSGPSGRPLSQISFALNYYFSGFDPFVFKATNAAIHATNSLLIFFLSMRLLSMARPVLSALSLQLSAGFVAVVWLLHPIQLLPVLHVVQRMTSLSALFLLAALLLHVDAREREAKLGSLGLVVAWGILWPLSFISKETGALFPVFVLAYELVLRRTAQGGLDTFARVLTGVVLAAGIGAAMYAFSPLGQWLWGGYELRPFSIYERLLTEGRVLWLYLGLIFAPRLKAFGLYHDDIALSHGVLDPWTTLPALLGLAGLVVLAWWTRKRAPLVTFGIIWFFVGHALESTVLPLEIAHEHRNYVPLYGLLLPVAWGLARLTSQAGLRRTLGLTIAAVVVIYPAYVTALRSHLFGDEVRRTQIEAQYHPESARANYDAGRTLTILAASDPPDSPTLYFARKHFEQVATLDPGFKPNFVGLIQLNCMSGQEPNRLSINELARRLRETPFAPGDRTVLYSLKEMEISGRLCLDRSDVERIFGAALVNPTAAAPIRAMLHSWLADYLTLAARDLPAAQLELDRSLEIVPGNPSNRLKRAQLAYLQGQPEEARSMLRSLHVASLSKTERTTLQNLGACLDASDGSVSCVRQ